MGEHGRYVVIESKCMREYGKEKNDKGDVEKLTSSSVLRAKLSLPPVFENGGLAVMGS